MSDDSRIPVSIRLLNLSLFDSSTFKEITDEVISIVNRSDGRFSEVKLSKDEFGKCSVRIFYSYSVYPPKWRWFLESILDKKSPLATAENIGYSYVCFIGLEEEIYVVTGGFGGQKFSRFIVADFGLEILVRLFDKDSRVVRNIQDRGLTGNLLGQMKFYRGDQRFSDENQFGKIFRLVQADINKALLKTVFGFTEQQLKRNSSGCMASDAFQINKSVDFDTMVTLVDKLALIMRKKPKFSLNKVEHLSRRKPQQADLANELDLWAMDALFTICKKGDDPDVDFCHKKFDEFLNADTIKIIIEAGEPVEVPRHSTFGQIVRLLKDSDNFLDEDIDFFYASVLDRTIVSYDQDGQVLTKGTIFNHIHGEFAYKGQIYFLLDKEWYFIKPSFIKDLEYECADAVKHAWESMVLTESFDLKKRENTYNQSYVGKDNYLVFDTITPDGIESCDILKYEPGALHLCHVKKGFDNSIRDLASQILISARRIQDDLRTGFAYIEKVELQTKKSKVGNLAKQAFPKDGLASLFKGRSPQQIFFCFAFADKATSKRSLKDNINKFDSNIAKFSLLELRRELLAMGFGFKVIQLNIS